MSDDIIPTTPKVRAALPRVRRSTDDLGIRRRKAAQDRELEDHLRLTPTAPITPDALVVYFALLGATDPKATATQRLARLVTLGVLQRRPTPSPSYELLPEAP